MQVPIRTAVDQLHLELQLKAVVLESWESMTSAKPFAQKG